METLVDLWNVFVKDMLKTKNKHAVKLGRKGGLATKKKYGKKHYQKLAENMNRKRKQNKREHTGWEEENMKDIEIHEVVKIELRKSEAVGDTFQKNIIIHYLDSIDSEKENTVEIICHSGFEQDLRYQNTSGDEVKI